MKNILKQIILEFHHEPLPKPASRNVDFHELPKNIRKANVFVGMRRSGKTWLMYENIHKHLKLGIPLEKNLYINFEDDRLLSFQAENFQDILTAYFDLYPEYAHDDSLAFYFDEIHLILGWEKFIRRLLDKEAMRVYVTGSSAKMLSIEIATSLRGRSISTEVFPFSFNEYLTFNTIDQNLPQTSKNQSLMRFYSTNYLRLGGFPETLYLKEELHRPLLQEYVNTVIFRDIVERHQINNSHILKLFLVHCLQNISAPLSITKVYHSLKSNGAIVGKNSLYEYLNYLEDAYLLFAIPIYDLSLRKQQVNPKKLYTIDPGILTAYSINPNFTQGAALENAVFLKLRRHNSDIYYYKTKSSKEIDFITSTLEGELTLYQSCIDFSSEKTKEREISALIEASNELNAKTLFCITLDTEDKIQKNDLTIQILPFWKWAGQKQKPEITEMDNPLS